MTVTVADPLLPRPGLLVLLATGPEGYRSLCRLSSHVQGHADREERLRRGLSWETLAAHREGLIALDGGLKGWAARFLQQGDIEAAGAYLDRFADVFPEGYVSLELQCPGDEELAALGWARVARRCWPGPRKWRAPAARCRWPLLSAAPPCPQRRRPRGWPGRSASSASRSACTRCTCSHPLVV
jgi:hypothetical protein